MTNPSFPMRRSAAFDAVTLVVLALALGYALRSFAGGFFEPLSDRHAFRQAQTAITAYYLAHGGPWFAYETPVLGAPYAIPFEFPLYQWIVALIHRVTGFPLDQTGRAISISFFLATLVPFFRIERSLGLSPGASRLGVALVVLSPTYLYWSRAFLIESTALFFSVLALDLGLRHLESLDDRRRGVALGIAATLAMWVKPTTAFAFLFPLGLFYLRRFAADPRRRAQLVAYARFALVAFVLPAVTTFVWTRYADHLKRSNPLAATFITEEALRTWNFGTTAQKLDPVTWNVFWDRTVAQTFGFERGLVAGLALMAFTVRPAFRWVAVAAGLLGTFAIFTNLHAVHDYYQYSTSILATLLVVLGLGHAERSFPARRWAVVVMALAIAAGCVRAYENGYAIPQNHSSHEFPDTGRFVRDHTRPDQFIVVYGDDWSPVIPYYAERRSIGNRWNYEPGHPALSASLSASRAGGHSLGAVVSCTVERGRGHLRAKSLLGRDPQCDAVGLCVVCY